MPGPRRGLARGGCRRPSLAPACDRLPLRARPNARERECQRENHRMVALTTEHWRSRTCENTCPEVTQSVTNQGDIVMQLRQMIGACAVASVVLLGAAGAAFAQSHQGGYL